MDRQAFLSLAPHEQCAFLLKQTFANPNDAIRKECEKMLQTLKQDPNKFMELLISIMISPNSESNALFPSLLLYLLNIHK